MTSISKKSHIGRKTLSHHSSAKARLKHWHWHKAHAEKNLSTESRNRFRFNACAQTATQRTTWKPRNISNEIFQVFKTTFWQFFERWFLEKVSFQQNVSERERALDLHQNWGLSGSENILFKQRFLSDLKVDTAVSACSRYMMLWATSREKTTWFTICLCCNFAEAVGTENKTIGILEMVTNPMIWKWKITKQT